MAKGKLVHIPVPGSGTVRPSSVRGNANRLGDARRSSGKSCLFCISRRVPGILSQGEWVLAKGEECRSSRGIHERPAGP